MFLQKNKLICILLLLTLFILGLGYLRISYAENLKGIFLVWNLFLAWIPFMIALLLSRIKHREYLPIKVIFVSIWLLFLPNAPYLITDLIHLRPRDGVPLWFDASIVFLFAFHGLLLGIVSSFLVHEVVKKHFTPTLSWAFISFCFLLSGYGIYLGRFRRWNSWDLLMRPAALLQDSFAKLTNVQAITVTIVFSLLLFLSYLIFYQLIHLKEHSYDPKNI